MKIKIDPLAVTRDKYKLKLSLLEIFHICFGSNSWFFSPYTLDGKYLFFLLPNQLTTKSHFPFFWLKCMPSKSFNYFDEIQCETPPVILFIFSQFSWDKMNFWKLLQHKKWDAIGCPVPLIHDLHRPVNWDRPAILEVWHLLGLIGTDICKWSLTRTIKMEHNLHTARLTTTRMCRWLIFRKNVFRDGGGGERKEGEKRARRSNSV